jgi:uncharacterized protein (TIGR03032 family)
MDADIEIDAETGALATLEAPAGPWLEVTCSPGMSQWLARHRVSLACSTYQTGKLLLFGRKPTGDLSVFERNFTRSMGLWGDGQRLWMSAQCQLWRLENVLRPGESYDGHDRLFVPRAGLTTGDLDIHDVAVESGGRPVFVATGFNCLATVSERYNFTPLWRPSFITAMVPEDRCHLNGLALEDGRCKYVTAVAATNENGAWRDHRRDGGVVIDVQSGEVVATGLSMPHSPRLHRGELWLLNSGTGYLGKIDRQSGRFEPVAFCPGYLRGLAFVGDHHAVVGLSRPRHDETFGGLALDETLAQHDESARCGVLVIDLRSGETVHWIRLEGVVTELYDVAVMPGVARPMALGFKSDEIQRLIALGDEGCL